MRIYFFNQTKDDVTYASDLIKSVFKYRRNKPFNIIFVDDEEILRLNKVYRNVDSVTDVISFALIDDAENEIDDSLGDIFINLAQAKRQALAYGHSYEREVAFLAVHGYLHLCGFDHQTLEEEEKMIFEQEKILKKANLERK